MPCPWWQIGQIPPPNKNFWKFPFSKTLDFARSNTISTQISNIYWNQLQWYGQFAEVYMLLEVLSLEINPTMSPTAFHPSTPTCRDWPAVDHRTSNHNSWKCRLIKIEEAKCKWSIAYHSQTFEVEKIGQPVSKHGLSTSSELVSGNSFSIRTPHKMRLGCRAPDKYASSAATNALRIYTYINSRCRYYARELLFVVTSTILRH